MVNYVLGFAFSDDTQHVVLIEKKRPGWQSGKLNGVGGHIEPGETSANAMMREFREETGVDLRNFYRYGNLRGGAFSIDLYTTYTDMIYQVKTMTDEMVRWYLVDGVRYSTSNVIPNLRWLIPMALSLRLGEHASGFMIEERD